MSPVGFSIVLVNMYGHAPGNHGAPLFMWKTCSKSSKIKVAAVDGRQEIVFREPRRPRLWVQAGPVIRLGIEACVRIRRTLRVGQHAYPMHGIGLTRDAELSAHMSRFHIRW